MPCLVSHMFKVKIIESNMHFELDIRDHDVANLPIEISSSDETELRGTSKVRTRIRRIAWSFYKDFREKAKLYGRAIIHNLGSTELQIRQTIERYTRKIDYGISHQERVNIFSNIIASNPHKFAEDLLSLEQRSTDLDAQLIGINLLVGKGYSPDLSQKHNLKGLILRCVSSFQPLLKSNSSWLVFQNSLDDIEITTDFRLFNCAIYHFFDNASKYIKSGADIIIAANFEESELSFTMSSRAIEEYEKELIFHEGYNGKHAGSQKGEGLGLYVFWLVLGKLNSVPSVNFTESTRLGLDGVMYQENAFVIKFPSNTLRKAE